MRFLFIVKCFLRVTMAVLTEVPRTKWKCPGVYSRIAKALQKTYQWYHNTLCVSTYVSWYTHCSRKYHIRSFSTGATGLRLCSGRHLGFPRFPIFFDLSLNKQLCKQPGHRWFETPSRPLWRRHCNAIFPSDGLYQLIIDIPATCKSRCNVLITATQDYGMYRYGNHGRKDNFFVIIML